MGLTVGIAEATVATAAALAPARVASAHATQTCSKHQSVAQCKNSFFFKKKRKLLSAVVGSMGVCCTTHRLPLEQRLAWASFWSRDAVDMMILAGMGWEERPGEAANL